MTTEQLDMYQEKALEYSQQNKQLRREIANERFLKSQDDESKRDDTRRRSEPLKQIQAGCKPGCLAETSRPIETRIARHSFTDSIDSVCSNTCPFRQSRLGMKKHDAHQGSISFCDDTCPNKIGIRSQRDSLTVCDDTCPNKTGIRSQRDSPSFCDDACPNKTSMQAHKSSFTCRDDTCPKKTNTQAHKGSCSCCDDACPNKTSMQAHKSSFSCCVDTCPNKTSMQAHKSFSCCEETCPNKTSIQAHKGSCSCCDDACPNKTIMQGHKNPFSCCNDMCPYKTSIQAHEGSFSCCDDTCPNKTNIQAHKGPCSCCDDKCPNKTTTRGYTDREVSPVSHYHTDIGNFIPDDFTHLRRSSWQASTTKPNYTKYGSVCYEAPDTGPKSFELPRSNSPARPCCDYSTCGAATVADKSYKPKSDEGKKTFCSSFCVDGPYVQSYTAKYTLIHTPEPDNDK